MKFQYYTSNSLEKKEAVDIPYSMPAKFRKRNGVYLTYC